MGRIIVLKNFRIVDKNVNILGSLAVWSGCFFVWRKPGAVPDGRPVIVSP
jgi:hypothetical protein